MTAATFILHRYKDPSQVSGVGNVAEGVEFTDGSVALRWPGEYPSTAVWPDIRAMEAIHGHNGLTVVEYQEPQRLIAAYQQTLMWLMTATDDNRPMAIRPHPHHPDRLLVSFHDWQSWRFWVALMDGSTHSATHEEVAGEWAHTWISLDGNCWLEYRDHVDPLEALVVDQYPDDNPHDEHPLETYDREDRG